MQPRGCKRALPGQWDTCTTRETFARVKPSMPQTPVEEATEELVARFAKAITGPPTPVRGGSVLGTEWQDLVLVKSRSSALTGGSSNRDQYRLGLGTRTWSGLLRRQGSRLVDLSDGNDVGLAARSPSPCRTSPLVD